jgi:hypothetical protein
MALQTWSLATRTVRICRPSAEILLNISELNSISNLLDNIPTSPFDFDDPDSSHKPDRLSNTFDNIPAPPLEFNPSSDTKPLNNLSELPLPQVRLGTMANGKDPGRSTSPEEPVQVPGDSDTQESSTRKRQTTPLSSKLAKIRERVLQNEENKGILNHSQTDFYMVY